jgi:hypothetical protein
MTVSATIESGGHASVGLKRPFQWNSINGQRSVSPEPRTKRARHDIGKFESEYQREARTFNFSVIPAKQNVLLLHGKGQRYIRQQDYSVPRIKDDRELLIKVQYVGLNPIDWKSA